MCRSYILKMKILPGIDGHYIGKSTQKQHIEKFDKGVYTVYSANFNSGYGALNMLLRYPIKELAVFGLDFYNGGVPQTDEEKIQQTIHGHIWPVRNP